ncbi:endopeptidase inhibitor activity protein [Homalodisca vitripennis]|nr:endopeptidase inhibitor activity protein [Homalodisca vitripennis]
MRRTHVLTLQSRDGILWLICLDTYLSESTIIMHQHQPLTVFCTVFTNCSVPERFNESIFDASSTYVLNICEVCGSSQCPYCPIYNVATLLHVSYAVWVVTVALAVLWPWHHHL